ncbi:MAG: hypothetical protein A2X22_02640 [Bacteroidetes bacterium GWF2_49_14]|nr:MAG: hypothetical protein A2X22_02640 [Bacteroidetes bacterium GWF2_49_14]HBB91324.1 DUF1697 domain-containing protein [Bacteroidales bacterium]
MEMRISLLRGINVSGQKRVPMSELKQLFEDLGFENVTTYINSGNVIFSGPVSDLTAVSQTIEQRILTVFGFAVPVITRTAGEMAAALRNNPFYNQKGIEPDKLHITFLANSASPEGTDRLMEHTYPPDRFIVNGREVYLHCPAGYGQTKLTNNFFENKLKTTATTRNLKTVKELVRLASLT